MPRKLSNKLKVSIHKDEPSAANSYMLSNDKGYICGGNAMIFIPNAFMTKICYPTRFKSRRSAESMISLLQGKI
jgi:hypothetical protein